MSFALGISVFAFLLCFIGLCSPGLTACPFASRPPQTWTRCSQTRSST